MSCWKFGSSSLERRTPRRVLSTTLKAAFPEVWLSVAGAAAPARAALAAEALSGTLLYRPMASESESPEAGARNTVMM